MKTFLIALFAFILIPFYSFSQMFGGQLKSKKVGSISVINCNAAVNIGTLTNGIAAIGLSSNVPYTGGNGGAHNGQTVTSTGVTGLTASLAAGSFVTGAGSLTYSITGTPTSIGTASFTLNIGGQICYLNLTVIADTPTFPAGSVFCNGIQTPIVDVLNPTTGRIWMDRNLGALQVFTGSTLGNGYGDLYQWGRRADGHQCRNSLTITTPSSIDQPAHDLFILTTALSSGTGDWRSPQNSNLWQGVNGVNNPCPSGYRIPTETEFNTERLSWMQNNNTGALLSPLNLPMAGARDFEGGTIISVQTGGYYWVSTAGSPIVNYSNFLYFYSNAAYISQRGRAAGLSVRCIKN